MYVQVKAKNYTVSLAYIQFSLTNCGFLSQKDLSSRLHASIFRYYDPGKLFPLFYKYGFAPAVGDQDWFTVLGFEV
jgi:hypothetical protein